MNKTTDLYRILQVHPDASADVIKKAYKTLAAKYHPDLSGGDPEMMQKINEAYAILSDPQKRKEYDLSPGSIISKSGNFVDTVSLLFSVIFLIALAKLIFRTFPVVSLIILPVGLLLLFVKYPRAFANIYIRYLRPDLRLKK